jgi:hypothetical protein
MTTCLPCRAWRLLLPGLLLAAACSEAFNDLEMHLGLESKTRPLAILCEPPEAAPGDTVMVTLYLHTPDPAALGLSWRVALDYDLGPYGTDEIERRLVPLTPPAPADEGLGFLRQQFRFVVPDSTLLWASALSDPVSDPATVALAAALLPAGTPSPPAKAAVAEFLAELTAAELAAMPAATQAAVWGLADRFASRIRFRAAIDADLHVEVTRNLTIRHSGRLGSPNANRNPAYDEFEVLAIPHPDVDFDDRLLYADELLHYPFAAGEGLPAQRVPRHADWTYYVSLMAQPQFYTSPYSGEQLFAEQSSFRWYYVAVDDPADPYPLFRDDAGDATEMWALDGSVRLEPPPAVGERRYRLICCLRDSRPEWDHYGTTPGLTLVSGELTFAPPAAPAAAGSAAD